jgi:TolB-like protein
MKVLVAVITAGYILCSLYGCTKTAGTADKVPKADQSTIPNQVNTPSLGNFNDRMKNLADQLNANAAAKELTSIYIVTSFSNLDKLDDTTAFGRLIAENMINGLQLHKWQILEARLTKGIEVTSAGEFSLSRDLSKLKDEYKISGVVTGTYSVADGNLTINARVIDVNTGIVTSSAQTYIPVQWLPESSSPHENKTSIMKIVSDGIK